MKLPWDKKYLKISFHVVFTILLIYVLGLIVKNIVTAKEVLFQGIGALISVLAPLLVALVFSFLFNPAVELFQNLWEKWMPMGKGANEKDDFPTRKRGTTTTYVVLLVIVVVCVKILVTKIGSTDINSLVDKINGHIQDFTDLFVLLNVKLAQIGMLQNVEGVLSEWATNFSGLLQAAILGLANSVTKAGGWVINLILGLTIGFYLLTNKEKIIYYLESIVDVFFHEKNAKRIKSVCHDMNVVFSGYIGGQLTDAMIMAVLISASFSLVQIPYPILIGIISGLSNLIPYVGAVVAFALSVTVGLFSGTPVKALYAVIIVLVLQQIDSIFIVPKVVGKSVELHPAFVLLSLAIFGGLFGLPGMIVAVPCGALIKIFCVRYYEEKKREKEKKE